MLCNGTWVAGARPFTGRNASEWVPAHLRPRRREFDDPNLEFPNLVDDLVRWFNPPDCSKVSFLEVALPTSGLGSNVHVFSSTLAWALTQGKFMVTSNHWFYNDPSFCAGSERSFECYFKPISHCSVEEARRDGRVGPWPFKKVTQQRTCVPQWEDLVRVGVVAEDDPRVKQDEELDLYWWRAMTTAIALRPNDKFLALMRREIEQYLPLPSSFLAFHVRHADKYREMKLLPLSDYVVEAKKLRTTFFPTVRSAFVTTEDDAVIRDARNSTEFDFWWTKNKRLNTRFTSSANTLGHLSEMRISFLNLFLSLESDAMVITSKSNWSRMMNELWLVAGKCKQLVLDMNRDNPGQW